MHGLPARVLQCRGGLSPNVAPGAACRANVNSGVQKRDVGLGSAAFAALMSGLCLWRGFAKDGED